MILTKKGNLAISAKMIVYAGQLEYGMSNNNNNNIITNFSMFIVCL